MRPPALHRFVSPNGTQGLRVLEARLSVLKVGGPTLNTRRDWTSYDLDLSAMAGNSPLEKMRDRKDALALHALELRYAEARESFECS